MYEYNFEITRVVDGDTVDGRIDLGFHTYVFKRIRLDGINAPETRTRDLVEKEKGLFTKNWLIDLVEKNDNFIIISHGVGKYGRVLAELFVKSGSRKKSVKLSSFAVLIVFVLNGRFLQSRPVFCRF